MKILQICHRVPYPAIDGANIAMMNLASSLKSAGAEVYMFALNTKKHFVEEASLPPQLIRDFHFQSGTIDTRITFSDALKNVLGKGSYNVSRFYDQRVARKIAELVSAVEFDIIQFETVFATPYLSLIRSLSKAKIVLRAHNAEHVIWQRLSEQSSNPLRKQYLRFLTKRLHQYERELLDQLDAIVPITDVDEKIFRHMGFQKQILTIPLGVELESYPPPDENAELCLFHLGSMDWLPNLEGVEWFLENCWPAIHENFPSLKLYLAGRGFPDQLLNASYPQVECEGKIADAIHYMQQKQIMIVPLLSGSGMRVKIIQGMALGKTIITTSIGAEGISYTDKENLLIADTENQFLEKVSWCIEHPNQCREIGRNGRILVEEHYSEQILGKKLFDFYKQLLSQ